MEDNQWEDLSWRKVLLTSNWDNCQPLTTTIAKRHQIIIILAIGEKVFEKSNPSHCVYDFATDRDL